MVKARTKRLTELFKSNHDPFLALKGTTVEARQSIEIAPLPHKHTYTHKHAYNYAHTHATDADYRSIAVFFQAWVGTEIASGGVHNVAHTKSYVKVLLPRHDALIGSKVTVVVESKPPPAITITLALTLTIPHIWPPWS